MTYLFLLFILILVTAGLLFEESSRRFKYLVKLYFALTVTLLMLGIKTPVLSQSHPELSTWLSSANYFFAFLSSLRLLRVIYLVHWVDIEARRGRRR